MNTNRNNRSRKKIHARGLERLLPKREVNPREELFNRCPQKWKDANNADGQPQNNGTARRHRSASTDGDERRLRGIELGDCMIQREQDTTSRTDSNIVHNTHQARRRRGRPMAKISDFGGSLGDVMSNRRSKRSATDHGNSQAQSTSRW